VRPERERDGRDAELAELLAEVRRIEVQSRRLVTDVMAGGWHSVFRGSGIEFEEVREYVEGDDPRSVDWNVTARAGRPFVKKYRDERELTVMFLLDVSASMQGAFGVWSARQTAARIAGCLALSAVRNGDKVGLITFSDAVHKHVAPERGMPHALRIIRDVLALPGRGATTNLAAPLERAALEMLRRAVLFLISDFFGDDWQDALAVCARRHDLIAVRLLVPELSPPGARLMRLRDPETGRAGVADWSDPRTRGAYGEQVALWRARTAESLRRAGVDLLDVPVPRAPDRDAVVRPILQFFRMREMRSLKS
jgi:uncharacterized protein (DUF58 family)